MQKQVIEIPSKNLELIRKLLTLNGEEISNQYGYKKNEVITNTAVFPNGVEVDVKLVMCDEFSWEKPYAEAVLFHNGDEIVCTEAKDVYEGEWILNYDGEDYIVNVIEDTTKENPFPELPDDLYAAHSEEIDEEISYDV